MRFCKEGCGTEVKGRKTLCDDCRAKKKKEAVKQNNDASKTLRSLLPKLKQCLCGEWHNNYFEKCDECREKILQGNILYA